MPQWLNLDSYQNFRARDHRCSNVEKSRDEIFGNRLFLYSKEYRLDAAVLNGPNVSQHSKVQAHNITLHSSINVWRYNSISLMPGATSLFNTIYPVFRTVGLFLLSFTLTGGSHSIAAAGEESQRH
jgi:hypothetical protein